jgi:hypothetical protein
MEQEIKEYKIPDELNAIIVSSIAHEELRNKYVRLPFGYKKALKCSVKATEQRQEFWYRVEQLYPELKGKKLNYNHNTKCVTIL